MGPGGSVIPRTLAVMTLLGFFLSIKDPVAPLLRTHHRRRRAAHYLYILALAGKNRRTMWVTHYFDVNFAPAGVATIRPSQDPGPQFVTILNNRTKFLSIFPKIYRKTLGKSGSLKAKNFRKVHHPSL